jgi:transcription-repair coupling factor (superfamily II helicase)
MAERRAVLAVNRSVKRAALTLSDIVAEVAALPALRSAMDALATERRVTIDSVWSAAVAPISAGWFRADSRPLLIIMSQIAESESVAAELGELLDQRVDVFPPGSEETELESLQHQETAQRLHVLSGLYNYSVASRDATESRNLAPPIIVTTLPALLHSVPSPNSLEGDKRIISAGRRIDVDDLRAWLVKAGYHATSSVQLPGEFAVRGGIMDIYPPDEPMPVRIELFDDEVESLRTFDITSQRSIEQRTELQLLAVQGSVAQDGSLLDYLTERTIVFCS